MVYAKGKGEYGNLGNGARDDKTEYVLVGDRQFDVGELVATLEVGDTENITIDGIPFNVFKEYKNPINNYTITNDNTEAISINEQKLTANEPGVSHITITDITTGYSIKLTRIVVEKETDRILDAKLDKVTGKLDEGSTQDNLVYRIKIVTNKDTGELEINTDNQTDRISIDGGATWQYNGKFIQEVDIPNKITEIPIKIGIQNNNGEYPIEKNAKIIIEKLTDDTEIKEITATSKDANGNETIKIANKVAEKQYEVIVEKDTDISNIVAKTNCEYSEIGIDGKAYSIKEQEKAITLGEDVKKEIKIVVKAESGREEVYTLIIYQKDEISLLKVTVNGTQAEKENEQNYKIKVPEDLNLAEVIAEANCNIAQVSIDGNTYTDRINQKDITLNQDITEIKIKLKLEDIEKEYTLRIEKVSKNTNLEKVEVEGKEATYNEEDGKYHYKILGMKNYVNIKAITEEKAPHETQIKLLNTNYELYEISSVIALSGTKVEVPITVKAEDGTEKTHTLVIDIVPDDTSIKEVKVNGENAVYKEGENRYEIRLSGDTFNVEVTLNDELSSLILGTNEKQIGYDSIIVSKTGEETIVQVKVTSQSEKQSETYEIVITEKSSNNKLDFVQVNGKVIEVSADGIYRAGIVNSSTQIKIDAVAESTYSKTTINGSGQNKHIAQISENIIDGKTTYTYEIIVTAEDGSPASYMLEVEKLEANYILDIYCGEDKESLEQAELREDGKYYAKIGDVQIATVKGVLESEKSTLMLNGEAKDVVQVYIQGETTEVPIKITAEDGSIYETVLIITRKESNADILKVTGEGVIRTEIGEETIDVYVDENLSSIDLDIILKSKYASLKLAEETEYEKAQITRNIDLSNYDILTGVKLEINVKAENGINKNYSLNIYQEIDLTLESVKINSEEISYNKENTRYEGQVPNGNSPQIEIIATNRNQTVQLLSEDGTVIASGTGVLTTIQTLNSTSLDTKYKIKVISNKGIDYGYKEYDLYIHQKSIETGIIYVKVDKLGTMYDTASKTYTSEVSGKETYPVEIKLRDAKANVRIEDETGILVENQQGLLKGELAVPNGETKDFKVIVTAENGNEEEYTLRITREKETCIIGKILTENVKEEHISKITVYKVVKQEIQNEQGEIETIIQKEIYKQAETNPDGSFMIPMYVNGETEPEVLQDTYEILVTKEGYLSYTVQEITIEEGKESDIGEYALIAGDVIETGEINIDDLVLINEYFGENVTSQNGVEDVNAKYDLNEDGIVNNLDREILKKNYGKLAEIVVWERQ